VGTWVQLSRVPFDLHDPPAKYALAALFNQDFAEEISGDF
jgi:hypothetical protein